MLEKDIHCCCGRMNHYRKRINDGCSKLDWSWVLKAGLLVVVTDKDQDQGKVIIR